MAIKFLSSENIAGDIDVTLSKNGITYLAVTNTNTGASANARVQVVGESAQIDIIATSVGYTGVSGWADSGVISTDSAASGGLILNSVAGIVKLQTSQTTALTIDNSQNATFAGDVEIAANLFSTGQNLRFHAAGTHVMNIDVNGKVYPNVNNAYDLGHSASLAWRNLYLSDSIIAGGGATFAGDVSMAKLTATKSGTAAVFNSGTTNVVATFTSTDGIASLQCVDSSGNVEFGASGNNFVVQPAGGVAQLSVGSSTSTFAGDITLTPGNSNKIILTPDVNSHYITGNAYWVDVVGNAAEVFRVFGGVGGTSEYFRITGTGAISVGNTGTNYGTSGEVLISNGNTSPTWGAATSVSEDNYYKIDDGLNFYLAFKEGSGTTVADVSGGRNNFTAGVGLDWSETGRFGYAQSFNGSNSYLNGTGPSSNITTFSAWVNNDGDGGIQNIVSGTYIMAYVSIYNNNFSIYDGVGWRNGGAVPANEWVHVAFSYDAAGTSGGLQKMYVNGVLGYSATAVGYTGVSSYISKVGIFTGAIRYFNGEITAIKTWDRILSDSEILAIYNQTALNENLTVLGKVGIGTTSPGTYGPATGTVKLDVLSGDIIRSGFTDPANSWIGFTALPGYNANQYPSVTSKSSLHFANNDKYCAFLEGTDTYFGMLNSASTTKVFFATGSQNSYLAGSGNFGIGVTGPGTKLDVRGTGNFLGTAVSGAPLVTIENNSGSTATSYGLLVKGGGNSSSGKTFEVRDDSGNTDLIVKGNGNVGIGTDSPQNDKLHVEIDSSTVYDGNSNQNGGLFVNNIYHEALNTFSQIRLGVSGASGASNVRLVGIEPSQAASDFAIVLRDGSVWGEKLRIKGATGNVGIGTTNPTYKCVISNNEAEGLELAPGYVSGANLLQNYNRSNSQYVRADYVASTHRWYQGDTSTVNIHMDLTGSGDLTVKNDIVAYGSPSDKRLKENIKPIESALDKVSKLQGVTFDWKKSDSILDIKEDIGFIAQDVQKVIPELVRENEDGMLSMRHQGIAPILLEAIKELKAEIEELKKHKCNCKE
jgi:hypothetical protein